MTKCYLSCPELKPTAIKLPLGTVTSISKRIDVSTNQTPMPTRGSSTTFCLDTGGTMSIELSINRKNGQDGMTNTTWLGLMAKLVDRWQSVTDGCTFSTEVSEGNADEFDADLYNVYIERYSYDYSAGKPDEITVKLNLKVGSMFGRKAENVTIPTSESYVRISDSRGMSWYSLQSGATGQNCIESCIIEGGSDSAFEYVTIVVEKKRLESFAPKLVAENDIIAGRNIIQVKSHGEADFIVTRSKLRGTKYTITGYAKAEMFRGTATTRAYGHGTFNDEGLPSSGGTTTLTDTPMSIIRDILSIGVTYGTQGVSYGAESIVTNVSESEEWSGDVCFPVNSNAWYVMQVCGLKLGAKIWFSEGKCYVMDVTKDSGFVENFPGNLDLYSEDSLFSTEDVVGGMTTGDEGKATVVNICDITYSDSTGRSVTSTVTDIQDDSRRFYGDMRGSLTVKEVFNYLDANDIATRFMAPLADAQSSVKFSVRDTSKGGWSRIFEPNEFKYSITDSVSDITVTNESHSTPGTHRPGLLMVSLYRYCFPDNYTEYTWGVQQSVDLSQTISQIFTALSR